MTSKWTKDEIRLQLLSNDKWLIRGMLAIHARQTEEEKATESTKEQNGIGFNGVDANILTDMVNQYKRTGYLSNRQINLIRKKMVKYANQLSHIANKEI
jgi:hypothetical protein